MRKTNHNIKCVNFLKRFVLIFAVGQIIILLLFMVDFLFNNTSAFPDMAIFIERLGKSGAKNYSGSLLFFVAGIASIYAVIIMFFKDRSKVSFNSLVKIMSGSAKGIASTVGTCLFGYMIGTLFSDINATEELGVFLETLNMPFGL